MAQIYLFVIGTISIINIGLCFLLKGKGRQKMNVPKEMRETYEEISKLLIEYGEKYLNKEYEELCLHVLEKLCRKRPSPLSRKC